MTHLKEGVRGFEADLESALKTSAVGRGKSILRGVPPNTFARNYLLWTTTGFLIVNGGQVVRVEGVLESLERLEAHIKTVEAKIEQQGFNTKPMWEMALAEFASVKQSLNMLSRKIDVFSGDMLNLRAEQLQNEERLSRLEAESGGEVVNTSVN